MSKWIDTRDCVPLEDGAYITQTVYGTIMEFSYTSAGGWNTHYENGALHDAYAMNDGYIVRWYKPEEPPEVPQEWKEEYWKGVNKW